VVGNPVTIMGLEVGTGRGALINKNTSNGEYQINFCRFANLSTIFLCGVYEFNAFK